MTNVQRKEQGTPAANALTPREQSLGSQKIRTLEQHPPCEMLTRKLPRQMPYLQLNAFQEEVDPGLGIRDRKLLGQ